MENGELEIKEENDKKNVIVIKDEPGEKKEESDDNNNKIKSKQSQLYFYIPLILSSFCYMCHNSLNLMLQLEPDYLIKVNKNLENTKLDKNKTRINNLSQKLIMWILFINILSKSIGHLILSTKLFKKRIDKLLLISNIFSTLFNLLFYFGNLGTKTIFFLHIINAFTSG